MDISVLHIDDCPNWVDVGSLLRTALERIGLSGTAVTFTAQKTWPAGSTEPTDILPVCPPWRTSRKLFDSARQRPTTTANSTAAVAFRKLREAD